MTNYQRIIIVPKNIINHYLKKNMKKFMKKLTETINQVEDDIIIKNTCDQFIIDEKKIVQFKNKCTADFNRHIIRGLEEPNGTRFLIFKN